MGRTLPEEPGVEVDAREPSEVAIDRRAMLYSAEALRTIESIREHLGRLLTQRALDLTKSGGRTLVTDDDVWSAVEDLGMTIEALSDEKEADGE